MIHHDFCLFQERYLPGYTECKGLFTEWLDKEININLNKQINKYFVVPKTVTQKYIVTS